MYPSGEHTRNMFREKLIDSELPGARGPARGTADPTRELFLAPGVGTQGATSADVARAFAACPDRVMPSASRSLLAAGPDVGRLRDAAGALASEFRQALGPAPHTGWSGGATASEARVGRRRP